ncbi:hypothetical protein GCM10020219_019230 [Nonomuraea dietziae]
MRTARLSAPAIAPNLAATPAILPPEKRAAQAVGVGQRSQQGAVGETGDGEGAWHRRQGPRGR